MRYETIVTTYGDHIATLSERSKKKAVAFAKGMFDDFLDGQGPPRIEILVRKSTRRGVWENIMYFALTRNG